MLELVAQLVPKQLKGLLGLLEPQGCKMTLVLPAHLQLFLLVPQFILILEPGYLLSQPQLTKQETIIQLQVKELLIGYFK